MEPEAGGSGAGGALFPQDVCRGSGHPEEAPADPGRGSGGGVGVGGRLTAFCVQALCVLSHLFFFKQ